MKGIRDDQEKKRDLQGGGENKAVKSPEEEFKKPDPIMEQSVNNSDFKQHHQQVPSQQYHQQSAQQAAQQLHTSSTSRSSSTSNHSHSQQNSSYSSANQPQSRSGLQR